MAKRGKNQRKDNRSSTKGSRSEYVNPQEMDDEIDAFHRQKDIVPLDLNDDVGEYDEDEDELVFDDEETDDDNEDEDSDDAQDTGFAAKIARQHKYLREKFGELDDEMHDDEEEDEKEKKLIWGGKKSLYYDGDIHESELESSDDEAPKEEEAEVIRLQKERAKDLSMEDFGLEDVVDDDSDKELTLEEISLKGKGKKEAPLSKEAIDDMDIDDSSPELVGMLAELNDALEQLESRVNPLLSKFRVGGVMLEGGMRYLEVKQLLLLAYCQAITFYLLLKSEGQPVRDHPVIARLVEIKGLLDKMKQLDGNLPPELEEFLEKNRGPETVEKPVAENVGPELASDSVTKDHASLISAARQEPAEHLDQNELLKVESLRDRDGKEVKQNRKSDEVGVRSAEMLKVRAALEEKLKQKGVFSSFASKFDKAQKHPKQVNRHLETYDDFDDDALDVEKGNRRLSSGNTSSLGSSKLSQLVSAKQNKPKVISGDDDLPKRDDIGERRRKHELRVLAGAGVTSEDDAGNELGAPGVDSTSNIEDDGDTGESADEFYEQVKQQRDAKIAAKAEIYTRTPATSSLPETVEGKRQITYQIQKNRGLTRPRKKLTKNPRKKYRTKHDKAMKRWGGQVQKIRKPEGPYGGEKSGINTRVSRSIRF